MSTWLLPRSELTPEQLRAIELPHTDHQVIFGAPGSGKTQVLIHRADELRRRLSLPQERFRIFVYTNALKRYIRSALDLLGLPEETVITFDDWCRHLYQRYISRSLPWDEYADQPDFHAVREAVKSLVTSGMLPVPMYDFALVDEGQDLSPVSFEVLKRIARHVTVCLDSRQQIYEHGSDEGEILAALGVRRRNLTLLDAYRCSPFVASLAAQLLEEGERAQYLRQVRTEQTERQTPLLFKAASFDEEKERLIAVLRERLLCDQRIAILFPLRRQVMGFAHALQAAGLEVESQQELDFSSHRPKLLTYHSAKGLTFDTVLLPRLVESSFRRVAEERRRRLLFVAITRATRWVYLSTVQGTELALLDALEPLLAQRILTKQERKDRPDKWPEDRPESDLDFL